MVGSVGQFLSHVTELNFMITISCHCVPIIVLLLLLLFLLLLLLLLLLYN